MLRGNFPTKLDSQGRIKIPTAHRKLMVDRYGADVYVTSVTGQSVLIYPMKEWEDIESKLLEAPKMRPEKMKFLRNTNYYGQVGTMDKQGRVLIPAHLRSAAEVGGEVAVMGYLTYLQVWNRTRFEKLLESDPYTDQDAAALADLGI